MLFGILLTAQVIICGIMAGLILIQQSEGGALGMGGGPSGFMSARGAGNLLTKLTWIFGVLLFVNSLGLTVIGNLDTRGNSVVNQIDTSKLPAAPLAPATAAPAASSSASSGPSLNDLPGASTPGVQTGAPGNLSALPTSTPSAAAPQAASSAAPAPAPKHTHMPAALGNTSVSLAPLGTPGGIGGKTSHSATPSIFPGSAASTAPSPAPASTPGSSQ